MSGIPLPGGNIRRMERWYAPTSPFARKVRIAAHELGLAGRLRLVEFKPWTDARPSMRETRHRLPAGG